MFLLCDFLIRLKVVVFITISMLNGMPEGGGGREEGYVPAVGGAKGSIQQRVQTFAGETVTQ